MNTTPTELLPLRELPSWDELPDLELYMDQVISLIHKYLAIPPEKSKGSLTSAMVNNYVKLGAMPAPIKRRYSKTHIAHLLMICLLKQVLPISQVYQLIYYGQGAYGVRDYYELFRESYRIAAGEAAESEAFGVKAPLDAALRAQTQQTVALNILEQSVPATGKEG